MSSQCATRVCKTCLAEKYVTIDFNCSASPNKCRNCRAKAKAISNVKTYGEKQTGGWKNGKFKFK